MKKTPEQFPLIKKGVRGVSLMEMIIVIVILGIIAGFSSTLLSGGFDAYFSERDLADTVWQGRLALARLNRDLRTVRSPTPSDLTISPATQITFVNTSGNTVSYALSGTTLMRNSQPLADGISNLNFSYIGNDGSTTVTSAAAVYYISASFTVVQNGASRDERTLIHPRNFP